MAKREADCQKGRRLRRRGISAPEMVTRGRGLPIFDAERWLRPPPRAAAFEELSVRFTPAHRQSLFAEDDTSAESAVFAHVGATPLASTGRTHRVDPKFASGPSEIPYKSLRVDPDSGSTL